MNINVFTDTGKQTTKKLYYEKFIIILAGLLIGGCIGISLCQTDEASQNIDGIILSTSSSAPVNGKSYKVFQSLQEGYALANTLSDSKYKWYYGTTVLLHKKGKYFYDEEIIDVLKGEEDRQIGVYRYYTTNDQLKTVPVIQIFENK